MAPGENEFDTPALKPSQWGISYSGQRQFYKILSPTQAVLELALGFVIAGSLVPALLFSAFDPLGETSQQQKELNRTLSLT